MKRNYLLASLLAIAAMFTGCSQDEEIISTNPSRTYHGEVTASLEDIAGINESLGTRAMFIGGNNGNRFANVWDAGDKILVYKDGVKVSTTPWSLDDEANEAYQGTKDAYFSGELEGSSFAVGDQVQLYVTQGTDLARSYTGQDGTIGTMSKNFSYKHATVGINKITGTTIKLKKAEIWDDQAYMRFFLKDENGQRLHLKKLIISATGDNKIITKVAANGTETTGDIEVNLAEYRGEYPGEIYVSMLNQGYTVDATTGAMTNGTVGEYQLTAVDANDVVYVFPGPGETQNAIKKNPTIGGLTNIERKMSKGTPEITMASQKKMIVGTTSTRTPADVKIGAVSIKDNATITYSSSNPSVATVDATTGQVTALTIGDATITATVAATDDYSSVNASYTLTVEELTAQAVDLGLTSGIKWASMNVGAESPTDYGTYFSWGETEGYTNEYDYEKDEYNWNTYKWGTSGNLTKYNGTDGKTILDASDDAATQNWGSGWRMPTSAEFNALLTAYPYSTDSGAKRRAFVTRDGVKMLIFYSAEDDELLILPCAGSYQNGSIRAQNTSASYWTSSRQGGNNAYMFDSYSSTTGTSTAAYGRSCGFQVRPVYVGQ